MNFLRCVKIVLALSGASLAACGGGGGDGDPPAQSGAAGAAGAGGGVPGADVKDLTSLPVDQDGPFLVGYRSFAHTYTPPGQTAPRKIQIHVWYPAAETNDDNPNYGPLRDPAAYRDAAPTSPVEAGGFPVVVHSHGSSSFGGSSPFLVHRFVSHGWVFVAPDHTGNLLLDPPNQQDRPIALYYERPLDVSQALDALAADAALGPSSRTSRVVMTGHSFGGYTTWVSAGATLDPAAVDQQCKSGGFKAPCTDAERAAFAGQLSDPRIVAAIPMAGGNDSTDWYGQGGQDHVRVPLFMMTGSEDGPGSAAAALARITQVPLTWIDIEGGCHQSFSLGGCKDIPDADSFSIVSTYALAFARRHGLGDASARVAAILDGTETVNPRVTLKRKNQ
ncbi:MAG: hypothetical protein IT374_19940 [Polyangiaceae bacterium]|nr:hypothetical protein [Polyangiaceae bacterium]